MTNEKEDIIVKTYELLSRDTVAEASRKVREWAANIRKDFLGIGIIAAAVAVVAVSGYAIHAASTANTPPIKAETTAERTPSPTIAPVEAVEIDDMPGPLLETAPALWAIDGVPLTREQTIEALLTHGYFSDAVPLSYEYQDYMQTYCVKYGCPYPLALAVAEVESRFDMDAVGAAGEIGIMQLNPGPGGSYHAELEAATGLDPTTPEGNIAGGCYKLGKFLAQYGDPAMAVMAYRMGQTGAEKALAAGVDPAEWAAGDMEAMERWECAVNARRGQ